MWDRVRKRCELDTVLGLSMTPTAVGLVLVEGHGADGEIMDQDAFDVPTRRGATAISTSEYVAGAMSRTRAMAHGRRRHPSRLEGGQKERNRIEGDGRGSEPCLTAMNSRDKGEYRRQRVGFGEIAEPGFPILPQLAPIACAGKQVPFDNGKIR